MNNNSKVPGKIFGRNINMQKYLNTVSIEQFGSDQNKIKKHLANQGIIKEEINKLKC